ncbi:MAG TPA: hypothetical protein ENJ32_09350, partial [Crenotrichaceae bacterium]|nr:hypothetical protein [Crenotrichaceae bacterium]
MNNKNNIAVITIEYILVAGFIVFEELIWNVLAQPIIDRLNHHAIFVKLRRMFLVMNRHLLLIVFALIFILTEILGVASGLIIVSGDLDFGILIYLLKVPLAAFTFWLFELTKQTLLTFNWLKAAYHHVMHWKAIIVSTSMYQSFKSTLFVAKNRIRKIKQYYLG